MKRVLITGAAGFIGSNLAQTCITKGWDVSGVDDMTGGYIDFVPSGVNLYISDFTSDEILSEIRRGLFDVVFHLAARPRVSYSVEHPLETNDVNVTKTLKLMDSCRGNIERFVFASSSSVYGGSDVLPTPSSSVKNPKSPYALQKSIIEDYLTLYERLYGFESVSLRFFNVFGPNQLGNSPYSTCVSAWLDAALRHVPLRFDGTGKQTRDMCYVDNVTSACTLAASKDGLLNAAKFNVGTGNSVSNQFILEELKKTFPDVQVNQVQWRPGDVMHTLADITDTIDVLGYDPKVDFLTGFDRTLEWFTKKWHMIEHL